MEPVGVDRTQILVLNYNGRDLLATCLPSLVEAARCSPVPCGVSVVDNASTDDSLDYLATSWPDIEIIREPNKGLASFNAVLARRDEPVVLLLNNDVKLEPGAVGPMIEAFDAHHDALFSAPACWTFDGDEYEGMRTRVRSRFGMVQGMCRVPGHEDAVDRPDLTAAAGPVLAVDRAKFLALGGYDHSISPAGSRISTSAFAAGWRTGRGTMSPDRSPTIAGLAHLAPRSARPAATGSPRATRSCSPGRTSAAFA